MGRHGAAGVRGTVGTGPARARAGLQELRQAPDAAWQLEARGCGAATPRKRARAARPPPPSPARGASHIPPQPPETAVVLAARPPPVPHSPVLGAGPGSRVLPEAAEASRLQRHGAERPLHSYSFTSRQPAPGPTEDRAPRALCSFLWQCSRAVRAKDSVLAAPASPTVIRKSSRGTSAHQKPLVLRAPAALTSGGC